MSAFLLSGVGEGVGSAEPLHGFPAAPVWKLPLASAPAAPPVTDGGRIFVSLRSGALVARALADGRALWSADLLAVRPMAVADGLLVIPVAEGMHGIAAESGARRWIVPGVELNGPVLLRGGWLVTASGARLSAFRASDGTEVWSRAVGRVEHRPALDGNTLYVSVTDGRVSALDLTTGAERWSHPVGSDPTEPFAFDGRVYVGAGGRDFVCLRGDSGEEDWRFQLGAAVRGAASADDLHVYVVSMDNLIRALHRTTGAVRWKQDLGYRPSGGPLLIGGYVLAGGMTRTIRGFVARSGIKAGELTLGDDAVTVPAVALGQNASPLLAVATGNLRNEWTLITAGAPSPSVAVAPLAELPGTSLPLPAVPPGGLRF